MELLKLLSASEIFAQVASFLLLFILLRIFAWKRLLKLLDDRKEMISSGFDKIEQATKELEGLKTDYQKRLNSIDSEAKIRIEQAAIEARRQGDLITKNANQEVQKIFEESKRNIAYELVKAKDQMKNEIVDMVIQATENVIKEKLTEKDDRRIVENFLNEIDKTE